MTLKAAKLLAGIVQKGNSKIHGSTWSIPPTACKVGAKLRLIEGSTCHKCYDFSAYKRYPSVQVGRDRNLNLWHEAEKSDNINALFTFASALAIQIQAISNNKAKKGEKGANLHRWFTGGDLQSLTMMRVFVQVAKFLPHIKFWLPTREAGIVSKYNALNLAGIPNNLVVRLSAPMVNGEPVKGHKNTSTVHKNAALYGTECGAYKRGGDCGDCVACWDDTVDNISYGLH